MSEADRARERVDFEAAAEAIEKGKEKIIDPSPVFSLPGMNEQRFVAATQLEVQVHLLGSAICMNVTSSFFQVLTSENL